MPFPTAVHSLSPLLNDTALLRLLARFQAKVMQHPLLSSSLATLDSITLRSLLSNFLFYTVGGLYFSWSEAQERYSLPLFPDFTDAFIPILDSAMREDSSIPEPVILEAISTIKSMKIVPTTASSLTWSTTAASTKPTPSISTSARPTTTTTMPMLSRGGTCSPPISHRLTFDDHDRPHISYLQQQHQQHQQHHRSSLSQHQVAAAVPYFVEKRRSWFEYPRAPSTEISGSTVWTLAPIEPELVPELHPRKAASSCSIHQNAVQFINSQLGDVTPQPQQKRDKLGGLFRKASTLFRLRKSVSGDAING